MSKKLFKIAFVIYLISVIILLILPANDTGIKLNFSFLGIRSDHWIHAIMFIPFMILCSMNFNRKNFFIFLFFAISFASFCESLHYFLPYRSFDIHDFYANIIGVLIGSFTFLWKPKLFG
jgi:glycopeptide antibiotics resistance protein